MDENDNFTDELIDDKNLQNNNFSNKPLIAGVLLIVAGVLGVINFAIYAMASSITVNSLITTFSESGMEITKAQIQQFLLICSVIGIIVSIFPILSAILCFKKKLWGFALGCGVIGIFSIGPVFISSVLSLVAVILIAQSKKDFS